MFDPNSGIIADNNSSIPLGRDDRNRHQNSAHDPKKRDNFRESMERQQKKLDRLDKKIETTEKQLESIPQDDLFRAPEDQRAILNQKLDNLNEQEMQSRQALGNFNTRIAHTNLKDQQEQIKLGKHSNKGYNSKMGDNPLA